MPGFHPLGSLTGRTSATLFEIRLENDVIVLRGNENEASSQLLKGSVVLCLPSPLKVEDVHLRMTGLLKVGWNDARVTPNGISSNRVDKSTEIFLHRWPAFVGGGSSSKSAQLQAGNYEWPFELIIPGAMAQSVEGLPESHVVYKLKATVARGKLAYDLHAWKPLRIVRTLDPASDLEFAHAMTVENVWPNKLEYRFIIPQKAVVFGTAVDVQMRFTLLLKGLKFGEIRCTLIELQEFLIPPGPAYSERTWKYQRDVETWTFQIDEEKHYRDILNDEGQDGYMIDETLPLPKHLARCLQDVEVHGIKIRHRVKFNVALHNPDGHVSELRAALPVFIFISPNVPISQHGTLLHQAPNASQALDALSHAPPLYGEHVLDQLYADIDQSGLITPNPQSGISTPFSNQSRAGSSENLALVHNTDPTGPVPPGALSSRLQNLSNISRNNKFLRRHSGVGCESNTPNGGSDNLHGHFEANTSPRHMGTIPVSEEHRRFASSGYQTPEHIDYSNLASLSQVPSYTTAVRTPPPPRNLSFLEAVPNYEAAISSPPTPERRYSAPVPTITETNEDDGANGRTLSRVGLRQ